MERIESGDILNEILDCLIDFGAEDKKLHVDESVVEESEGILDCLKGYKVKVKTSGSHVHDGQMVEYVFKFESPEGKKTKYYTDMCLMIGFNTSHALELE